MAEIQIAYRDTIVTALIDDADLGLVKGVRWCFRPSLHGRAGGYAYVRKPKMTYMHRWLLNPPPGMQVDHINGNGLDNRRENLRLVTRSQNGRNCIRPTYAKHPYRGVEYSVSKKKWRAAIEKSGLTVRSRWFRTIEEAAMAYDDLIDEHYDGDGLKNFSAPNFRPAPGATGSEGNDD